MIQHLIDGAILKTNDTRVYLPVDVTLAYDPDYDPLAVMMIFQAPDQEEVCWTIGREFLMRGSVSLTAYGDGDVRLRFEGIGTNRLLVCLKSPCGHADIGLNQVQVVNFLSETSNVVRVGDEHLDELIDEAIEEILGA